MTFRWLYWKNIVRIDVLALRSNVINNVDLGHLWEGRMHRIGFVVFPNFNLMGFAAVTVFETANSALALDEPAYAVTLLSETGGFVSCSAGFRVETQPFGD